MHRTCCRDPGKTLATLLARHRHRRSRPCPRSVTPGLAPGAQPGVLGCRSRLVGFTSGQRCSRRRWPVPLTMWSLTVRASSCSAHAWLRHTAVGRLRSHERNAAMPGFRYRLGDEVHDLRTRTLVMGILNRTPDSFYDQAPPTSSTRCCGAPRCWSPHGADLLDVGGVKAGPGPEVGEAEELDRVDPADRRVARALRRRHLVRHLAGVGCSTRRARPVRSSATTSAASATPTTCAVAAKHERARRGHPHPVAARRRPIPTRTTTTWSATSPRSCWTGRAGPKPPGSRPNRSRSMPDSTSARRPRRAPCCSARARRWRRSAIRCCCRRRTSGSSATCSSSRSTTGGRRRSRPSPTASRTAVGSCGSTTSRLGRRSAA